MSTSSLVQSDRKQKAEATNFEAFRLACPHFAGRPIVTIEPGGDPPDILCRDGQGARIGVELVQWLNQAQMARSKRRYRFEDSYRRVIRSCYEPPPLNTGLIFIFPKVDALLRAQYADQFRKELYAFVAKIDAAWPDNPEFREPQGSLFTQFEGYPSLIQHLSALHVYPRRRHRLPFGADWLTFPAHGGAYTPNWMKDALLENIGRKIDKYMQPRNRLKLTSEGLTEFYLLAYYDEAVLHNTPYHAPDFGFREIAAILGKQLASRQHLFGKVFLYSQLEKVPAIQVWPSIL